MQDGYEQRDAAIMSWVEGGVAIRCSHVDLNVYVCVSVQKERRS